MLILKWWYVLVWAPNEHTIVLKIKYEEVQRQAQRQATQQAKEMRREG